MAPVVHNRVLVERARQYAEPTLVVVESLEIVDGVPKRYKSANGFIIDALNGKVYVAVRQSKLSPNRGDIINVRFQNKSQNGAEILFTDFDLSILEIVVEGTFHPVNISNLPLERTDIIILAQAKMTDELRYSSYTTSVIIPRNATLPTTRSGMLMVFQSLDFCTIGFSANMEIEDIFGAPIFDFHGTFLGVVHSCEEKLVFARSSHFIPSVRSRILQRNQMQEVSAQVKVGQ